MNRAEIRVSQSIINTPTIKILSFSNYQQYVNHRTTQYLKYQQYVNHRNTKYRLEYPRYTGRTDKCYSCTYYTGRTDKLLEMANGSLYYCLMPLIQNHITQLRHRLFTPPPLLSPPSPHGYVRVVFYLYLSCPIDQSRDHYVSDPQRRWVYKHVRKIFPKFNIYMLKFEDATIHTQIVCRAI